MDRTGVGLLLLFSGSRTLVKNAQCCSSNLRATRRALGVLIRLPLHSPQSSRRHIPGQSLYPSAVITLASHRHNSVDITSEITPKPSLEVAPEKAGEASSRNALLRTWFHTPLQKRLTALDTIVDILKIFEGLPKGTLLDAEQDNVVLDLLRRSNDPNHTPPREMLTLMGDCLHNYPPSSSRKYPPKSYLLLPIYQAAWNRGQEDGDPNAALRLVTRRNLELIPPERLVSKSEAADIVESLASKWPELADAARTVNLLRDFRESPVEEQETIRQSILTTLHNMWENYNSQFAANILAKMYSAEKKGQGLMAMVPPDGELHKLWRHRAAEQGHYPSAYALGLAYSGDENKYKLVLPVDLTKARRFFEISAKHGFGLGRLALYYYLDPMSSFPTAEEHTKHWGVEPDDQRAAELFSRDGRANDPLSVLKRAEMVALDRAPVPSHFGQWHWQPRGEDESPSLTRNTDPASTKTKALIYARGLLLGLGWGPEKLGTGPLAQEKYSSRPSRPPPKPLRPPPKPLMVLEADINELSAKKGKTEEEAKRLRRKKYKLARKKKQAAKKQAAAEDSADNLPTGATQSGLVAELSKGEMVEMAAMSDLGEPTIPDPLAPQDSQVNSRSGSVAELNKGEKAELAATSDIGEPTLPDPLAPQDSQANTRSGSVAELSKGEMAEMLAVATSDLGEPTLPDPPAPQDSQANTRSGSVAELSKGEKAELAATSDLGEPTLPDPQAPQDSQAKS